MRASRFVHTMGMAAALAGGTVLLLFHAWETLDSRMDIKTQLSVREKPTESIEESHADQQAVRHSTDDGFVASYYFAEPSAADFHARFFDTDAQRRIQHDHLLDLLRQERQHVTGGRLSRISDVVVPFLKMSESTSQSSDFRSQGRSIDMSSGFIQKLFRLGHDETWMDDLPVIGMRVEEDQLTDEYTVKGFKVGLPGKWLWLVHEPLQEGEEADATYLELRKAW